MVGSAEVADGQLNAADISDAVVINDAVTVDLVSANACGSYAVTVSGAGDISNAHIVATPDAATASPNLSYTAESTGVADGLNLKICNVTNSTIDDANTTFQFLIIR